MEDLYCRDLLHFSDAMSDSKRIMIITELMSGRALSASFLSSHLKMSPQATRFHLKKLEDALIISPRRCGKYRYYEIKDVQTADYIESVFNIIPPTASLIHINVQNRKKFEQARTCYKHLAGVWAVALTRLLLQERLLIIKGNDFFLTPDGNRLLHKKRLLFDDTRRGLAGKRCIDFSEHRDHIGGELGALILDAMIKQGWVKQRQDCRELTITPEGYNALNNIVNHW